MTTAVMWVERGHGAGTVRLFVRATEDADELRQTLVDTGFRWDCGALTTAAPQAVVAELLAQLRQAGVELLDNALPGDAQLLNELGIRTDHAPVQTRAAWEQVQAGHAPVIRPAAASHTPIWAWQVHKQHVWVWLIWLSALAGLLAFAGVGR